jgi:SAM-dependent methyltransferase
MDEYFKHNKDLWNEITPIHARSEFYDVAGFKAGKCALKPIELEEVGDVSGKSLLHLQCHFGLDTLSWARRGARATGVDFSEDSIETAKRLADETGIKAEFIRTDIYALPELLKDEFDIVFMSYGVLCWLPELTKWAEIIAHFLKPGGFFYIVEGHPFLYVFNTSQDATEFEVHDSYFHCDEPIRGEYEVDYAEPDAVVTGTSCEWTHSLGDIINALIQAGLRIDFLHEFPYICWKQLPFMHKDKDGWWRIKGDKIPLIFSLKATKPGL